MLFDILTYRGG